MTSPLVVVFSCGDGGVQALTFPRPSSAEAVPLGTPWPSRAGGCSLFPVFNLVHRPQSRNRSGGLHDGTTLDEVVQVPTVLPAEEHLDEDAVLSHSVEPDLAALAHFWWADIAHFLGLGEGSHQVRLPRLHTFGRCGPAPCRHGGVTPDHLRLEPHLGRVDTLELAAVSLERGEAGEQPSAPGAAT